MLKYALERKLHESIVETMSTYKCDELCKLLSKAANVVYGCPVGLSQIIEV